MKKETGAFRPVYLLVIVLTLCILGFTAFMLRGFLGSAGTEPETARQGSISLADAERIFVNGESYTPKRNLETLLLMGVDSGESRKTGKDLGGQADVLLLLVLDHNARTYRLLQINRDTMTQIPVLSGSTITGEIFAPVCLSHGYGSGGEDSCENTVRAVSALLAGVNIDGYAAINMDSIGDFNDAVGGVRVTVDKDLTVVNPAFAEGASVHLDGESAEDYLRVRMAAGESDNLSRMSRHRRYMTGWLEAARKKTGESGEGAVRLMEELEPLMVTSLSEKRMAALAEDAFRFTDGGVYTIEGVNESNGSFNCFYADEDSILDVIVTLFYDKEENG